MGLLRAKAFLVLLAMRIGLSHFNLKMSSVKPELASCQIQ